MHVIFTYSIELPANVDRVALYMNTLPVMLLQKIIILALVVLSHTAFSQTLYSTITMPEAPSNIQGMMMGDDIFLSMKVRQGLSHQQQLSMLVHANGEYSELDLSIVGDNPVVAAVKRGDSTCFYYLKTHEKNVVLATMVMTEVNKKGEALPTVIDIPGKIYGSYVEGSDLFMLCGVKNEFKLKLLQIRNGQAHSIREFGLTFNLGKRKDQRVTFFDMSKPVTPQVAAGDVKICKNGRAIWIIVDEPFRDADVTMTNMTLFRTTVIRLDLDTQETVVKSFYETLKAYFTSAIMGNDVYRMVSDNGLRIDQIDFYSGKKKGTVSLPITKEQRRDTVYARIGSEFKTYKTLMSNSVLSRWIGNYLIVDSLANGERVFTVGSYGDRYPYFLFIGGPLPIASLIITTSSLVIGELVENPISMVYRYYIGNMEDGFKATHQVPLLRNRVDDFDSRQVGKRVSFSYRGYIHLSEKTFEIVQKKGSSTIEVRKFELDDTSVTGSSAGN